MMLASKEVCVADVTYDNDNDNDTTANFFNS